MFTSMICIINTIAYTTLKSLCTWPLVVMYFYRLSCLKRITILRCDMKTNHQQAGASWFPFLREPWLLWHICYDPFHSLLYFSVDQSGFCQFLVEAILQHATLFWMSKNNWSLTQKSWHTCTDPWRICSMFIFHLKCYTFRRNYVNKMMNKDNCTMCRLLSCTYNMYT